MEKTCKMYNDFTRDAAREEGFCSECSFTSCPFCDNPDDHKRSRRNGGMNDWEAMDREDRKRKNKQRRARDKKRSFTKHSDNDDW